MTKNISNQNYKHYYKTSQVQQPVTGTKSNISKYNYLTYGLLVPSTAVAGGFVGNNIVNKEKLNLKTSLKSIEKAIKGTKEFKLRDKILCSFSDLVLNEKEGHPVDMPNCLMVTGDDPKYCERMIDWIGKTSYADYKTIKVGDDILAHLEQIEENFPKSGNRTLLHVKNMEQLIDHSKSKDWVVESMKDIMSAAAEDYHTTMIFQTQDPSRLDSIALQPHRVRHCFNLNEVPEFDFFECDRKINLYSKQLDKFENLTKNKNKKVLEGVGIGAAIGIGIAFAINYGKKIINKNKK